MTEKRRLGLLALMLIVALGTIMLGWWQIERRAWKHDLIAAVNARVDATPVAPPGPAAWRSISAENDAYRRVRAIGVFDHDAEILVQAVTGKGPGFWVMTPLDTGRFTVWINRGFVPPEKRSVATRGQGNPSGPVTVTGLLRISEPGGGFLRRNDPNGGRWFSRDVAAMSDAKGLGSTAAPYFIDADAKANPGGYPLGGLTVIAFRDHHLIYAITWFALAAMALAFAWKLRRPYHRP